jgi:RimJ/RimL family protein N-acetyltransferase
MTATEWLRSERLDLCPLDARDADEMVAVLDDVALYAFTGGEPPTRVELEARYRAQVAGSGRIGETWRNWIVRRDKVAIGFVQATVVAETADIAWLIGTEWQGRGLAKEATRAMCDWLRTVGVDTFVAHIHPEHVASAAVAAAAGLMTTGELDADGEQVWRSRLE